jgi:hypothetical protein
VQKTVRQIFGATIRIDWSQFDGPAALRCTIGVLIPLVAGLLFGQPLVSAFGVVGAMSVGFGSFQGAYRSRATVMVLAAFGMAVSVFIGSVAGHSDVAEIAAATVSAFIGGLLVALGPSAAFVGLQSVVAVLIASGFPADAAGAAIRAAIVLGGGLVQTLLVVLIWPLRRFSVERQTIAAAYRSLGRYASNLPAGGGVAPEPHTFASIVPPIEDPHPFSNGGAVLVFQALFDEAERIRASLASIAAEQRRLSATAPSCTNAMPPLYGRALIEIAEALEHERDPAEGDAPIWEPIDQCLATLPPSAAVDALLGQIRAAWRTASLLTSNSKPPSPPPRFTPLRPRPPIRDALTTLRVNLTLDSTACRHALRLAVAIAVTATIYRLMHLQRGYWMPMTALLVLKPDFHDTFARGIARIAGTILGAGIATLIVREFAPGTPVLATLVLAFVWSCYAVFRVNYALFTVCVTGYVVFILMLSGVGEMTAATTRAIDTIAGGALALAIYAIWPTWAATTVRSSLAALLEAHGRYVAALLDSYVTSQKPDLHRLAELRAEARLARSNFEADAERMLVEPSRKGALGLRTTAGLIAALRRHALAALALHAGLERGIDRPSPAMAVLSDEMKTSLSILAEAVSTGTAPPPLPPLRQTQLALAKSVGPTLGEETDLMVDGVNTMAELLTRDAARHA